MDLLYKELLPYEHIIFDWNGTLLSDVELVCNILSENLEPYNLPRLTLERFRDCFRFPVRDFYNDLGMREEHFDAFQDEYHRLYNERYKSLQLYEGTHQLLSTLNAQGKTLSVLSAAEQTHLDEAIDHFELRSYMGHVYGLRNTFAEGKVARGHELMKVLPTSKDKTIIIGDTLYDAEVGKSLGITTLLIADGHQSYEQLSKAGCRLLASRYV